MYLQKIKKCYILDGKKLTKEQLIKKLKGLKQNDKSENDRNDK